MRTNTRPAVDGEHEITVHACGEAYTVTSAGDLSFAELDAWTRQRCGFAVEARLTYCDGKGKEILPCKNFLKNHTDLFVSSSATAATTPAQDTECTKGAKDGFYDLWFYFTTTGAWVLALILAAVLAPGAGSTHSLSSAVADTFNHVLQVTDMAQFKPSIIEAFIACITWYHRRRHRPRLHTSR
jgi:hypothetical protein